MKKEKYIYGSKELEIANTIGVANIIRGAVNFQMAMTGSVRDALWLIGFDKENRFSFLELITNFKSHNIEEFNNALKIFEHRNAAYGIIAGYNSEGSLKIKEESLFIVKKVLALAQKHKANITDYLVVSKDSFFSFYKSKKIKKLITEVKKEIEKEKIINDEIIKIIMEEIDEEN